MKIEFTDERIKKMAKAIDLCDTMNTLQAAAPAHVICRNTNSSCNETTTLRSFNVSHSTYDAMIKPIVDEYQSACLEASRKALLDIKCMFRDLADGNTSLLNTGQ